MKKWAFILAGGILLALVSSVAYATIPDANDVVHGCYKASGGQLRVVDPDVASCNPSEVPLDWNQTGPQGADGPAGPAGPPGPTGPKGDSATSLWAEVDAQGTLLNGSGALSVQHPQPGVYNVQFDRDVEDCAPIGSLTGIPDAIIVVGHTAAGDDFIGVGMVVSGSALVDRSFNVAVFC